MHACRGAEGERVGDEQCSAVVSRPKICARTVVVGVFSGGSHQRVNSYACSLSQMVMQEDTEIYPGSGKRRPYVQRGREVCIILHLSACTGANTSVV